MFIQLFILCLSHGRSLRFILERPFPYIENTKKPLISQWFYDYLATSYSHRGKPPTTIGAKELNFCVRYGNRCDLFAIITRLFYWKTRFIILQY